MPAFLESDGDDSAKFLESENDLTATPAQHCRSRSTPAFLESDGDDSVRFLESENDLTTTAPTQQCRPRRAIFRRRRRRATVNSPPDSSENEDDDDNEYRPSRPSNSCAARATPTTTARPFARGRRRRASAVAEELLASIATAREMTPPPAATRPRSTRSEAHNAITRIAVARQAQANLERQLEEVWEVGGEEAVVKLEEISMASTSDAEEALRMLTDEDAGCEVASAEGPQICVICAEPEAPNPVRTTCCDQWIGCKNCVKRWYRTTNISDLNARSPLSRGQSHENHKRCPFCRTAWPERMLITGARHQVRYL